jgi:DNA polymerase-1
MFHPNYYTLKIVQSSLELYSLVKKLKQSKVRYFDTETTGLKVRYPNNDRIVGFTFAMDDEIDDKVYYIPVAHDFEGEYRLGHVNYEKLKPLTPADFPHFNEEILLGDYNNMDLDEVLQEITPVFYEPGILVAHNIMFDLHVLACCGIDVETIFERVTLFDTQIAFHTVEEEAEKKLESIIKRYYNIIKTDYNDVVSTVWGDEKKSVGLKANNKASFQHVQIPIGAYYSGEDVWFMKQLYFEVIDKLVEDEQDKLFYKMRMPFLPVLWRMERRGTKVDKAKLAIMTEKAQKALQDIEYELYELVGLEFSVGSGQQLAELLHGHVKKLKDKDSGGFKESCNQLIVDKNFGFPVINWTDGGNNDKKTQNILRVPQTNATTLEELLDVEWNSKFKVTKQWFEVGKKVIKLLLKHAKLKKLYSVYMAGLLDDIYQDGKVHPSFNICGTDSWRLSCDSPNLQQLPRPLEGDEEDYEFWNQFEIRELFIPDEEDEVIIASDWNNLEKKITAHFTKDPALLRLFAEKLDGHGQIATMVFAECKDCHPNEVKKKYPHLRQRAKSIGFAMDYGGTAYAVQRNLKCSLEEAQGYVDAYFEGFSGLAQWATKQKQFGRKFGYVLTILGHKRHLSGILESNGKIRSYYERICLNAPIQGSAADIAIRAQIAIDKDPILRAINCRMIIQIHDEIVLVAPRRYVNLCMERIAYHMEFCLPHPMVVPLTVGIDYGKTYAEAK